MMSRISKRPTVTSPVDPLFSLPDLAIINILSLLPTKDVVKTSVLSKRWKEMWTNVPTFDFQLQSQVEGNKKMVPVQFINNVFLHSVVKNLQKFRLYWYPDESEVGFVSMWMRHAIIHRNVRILDLSIRSGFACDVPGELYTSGTLESLDLYGQFVLKLSGREVYLPKIRQMKLIRVKYESGETLYELLSGCPVLVALLLACAPVDNVTVYKFCSLSLRILGVYGYNCWPALDIDAPVLRILMRSTNSKNKVTLCSYKDAVNDLNYRFCNWVSSLVHMQHQAKFLALKGEVGDALSNATPRVIKSTPQFNRLTELDIQLECCKWSCLNVMLEQSNMLQVLKLLMEGGECDDETHKSSWMDPSQVPKCLSSSLSKVSFKGLAGREDEVSMIKYILKNGAFLESVELVSRPHAVSTDDFEFKFRLLQKISMFPRGSDHCELLLRFQCCVSWFSR